MSTSSYRLSLFQWLCYFFGIRKLWKKCFVAMFGDFERTTSVFSAKAGSGKVFKSINSLCLKFWACSSEIFPFLLRAGAWICDRSYYLYHTKNHMFLWVTVCGNVIGIIMNSIYESNASCSRKVDAQCGLKNGKVTWSYRTYGGLAHCLYLKYDLIRWNNEELEEQRTRTWNFKDQKRTTFS